MQLPLIAVVEDSEESRLLLRMTLGERYELREYATGPDALVGLARERPALVLLDISLPGMNGVAVLQRMRAEPRLRTLPVVALTAHSQSGDREALLAAGFDDYVAKPIVNEDAFVAVIETLLGRVTPPGDSGYAALE